MINTAIISETNLLGSEFDKFMAKPLPDFINMSRKQYNFLLWALDKKLDDNEQLYNDICMLSNERADIESFEQYKIRRNMVKSFIKYRSLFLSPLLCRRYDDLKKSKLKTENVHRN